MGTQSSPRKAWSRVLLLTICLFSMLSTAVCQAPTCSQFRLVESARENTPAGDLPKTLVKLEDFCTGSYFYNMAEGNDKDNFELDSTTGKLDLKVSPDAEQKDGSGYTSAFYLRIEVSNSASPPLTSNVNVVVRIISINDNTPEFSAIGGYLKLPTDITVREDRSVGGTTPLYQCSVVDEDNPNGADIGTPDPASVTRVQIKSGALGFFALDPYLCKVFLIKPLDYDTTPATPSFTVNIGAYDLGDPQRITTAALTINVMDKNDNAPTCPKDLIVQTVDDGQGDGTVVANLNCNDGDASTTLTYATTGPKLKVDSASGEVTLASAVNSDPPDSDKSFEEVVTVTDDGTPIKTTSVTICVYVNDVDDETPQFGPDKTATLRTDALVGDLVTTVTATDADTKAENQKITYSLKDGACTSQDSFAVDPDGGELLVSDTLAAGTVVCTVQAHSSDKATSTSTTLVTITITEYNSKPPEFTKPFYSGGPISEDAVPSSATIVTVTATDPDGITYTMPTDSPFRIKASGEIFYEVGSLDYETNQRYLLEVVATDDGDPPLSSTAFVNIAIGEVNEHTPSFSAIADVTVPELSAPGFVFATAVAEDKDLGLDGTVEYSLKEGNVPFVIDAKSGKISVGFALDYDKATEYKVVVLANDLSAKVADRKTGSTTFTMSVGDDDTHSPTCEVLSNVKVTPDVAVGNTVATLTCTDNDVGETPTFGAISSDPNNDFKMVDTTSGAIALAKSPVEGTYQISVAVNDGGGNVSLNLQMPVLIQVETNLMFGNLPTTLEVAENTTIGTTLMTVQASGSYAGLTYSLVSCSACKFFINPSTGELRLLGELDRETGPLYTLTVRAESVNSKIKDSNVIITVTDINDNPPVYPKPFYEFSLAESSGSKTLDTITATDTDAGTNAAITYAIASGDEYNNFTYNSNTGVLSLTGGLDYDTVQSYTLVLTATDGGSPALTGSTTVFIAVTNVDESVPEIIPAGGTITKSIPENSTIGAVLFRITASDADFNDAVDFSITSGNPDNKFFIDAENGDFYLVSALDREKNPAYSIGVLVKNDKDHSASTTVSITVTDVNDEIPTFNPGNYVFTTADNTAASTSLGRVTVTDKDLAPNNAITLTVVSGDAGNLFTFNGLDLENTAVLNTVANPYVLEVRAADGGSPSLSSTATVTVVVEPPFKQPAFMDNTITVPKNENIVLGTSISDATATAQGATEGTSGDLQYSILTGDSTNRFYIEPYNGQIILRSPLDYDTATSYSLIVKAENRNSASLSATMSLTVSVVQVNLDTPTFGSTMYTSTVSEAAGIGTNVGAPVQATDTDPGRFGTVSYSIETNTAIAVDSTSGQLSTKSALEYSVAKSYYLEIYATDDAGEASKTGTSLVIISVIDTNNHAPAFPNSPYTIGVPENLVASTSLCIIKAEDLDSGAFGTVTYSISSGNDQGRFAIGASDGILSLNSQVNYENTTQYILTVEAADGGTPSLTGTATVTLNIKEVNDNAPTFAVTRVELVIPTSTSPLTTVYTVAATDQDPGTAGTVGYVIKSGNTDQYFDIDPVTGVIATAKTLLATGGYYILNVLAVDKGTPPLTGTTTVAIAVQDFSNAPSGDYNFNIGENEAAGTSVGTIAKPNATLTIRGYAITGGNYGNNFAIAMTADQGADITAVNGLDREDYGVYILTVEATHTTGTLTLTVRITVTDANDNPPVFSSENYTFTVMEMTPVGTSVGQVTVTDADEPGVNTAYTLEIRGAYMILFFQVDSNTGIISTKTEIDFECDLRTFSFRIVASDDASPQQIASTTVTINILNFAENEVIVPMEPGQYISQVMPYNLKAGTAILNLTAEHFKLETDAVSAVFASASDTGTLFTTDSSTGTMVVNEGLKYPYNSRLVQWVTCSVTNSSGLTNSRVGVVRFDLFSKSLHLVSLVSSLPQANLEAERASLLTRLEAKFTSPQAPRIFTMATTTDNQFSAAHIVGIKDSTVDTVAKIDQFQFFLTKPEVLANTQADVSGTPASGISDGTIPIVAVAPYDDGTRVDDTKVSDPEVIAVIVLGVIAGVALIVAIFATITYACYKTRRAPPNRGNGPPRSERPVNNPRLNQPEINRVRPAYRGNPPKPNPDPTRVDPAIFQS